tara:strand:+ start:392 stop:880 length:489 start_codon:yes stop_codon:yes gene_type:complete
MIKIILLLTLFTLSQLSFAEEISEEKKLIVDEFMQVSGELDIEIPVQELTKTFITLLAQNKNLDPRVVPIAEDEIAIIMQELFLDNGFLNEVGYATYGKYFTIAELKDMVAFYKTPTGKKMVSVLPKLETDALSIGEAHVASLLPVVRKRLMNRFRGVGIVF